MPIHLTLTSVVFEIKLWLFHLQNLIYLTLTSVVFEIEEFLKLHPKKLNLTLTSVVFEIVYVKKGKLYVPI